MAQAGDIVEIRHADPTRDDGVRWVVMALVGGASGQDAHLARPDGPGFVGYHISAARILTVDRPAFEAGERVRVGALGGAVVASQPRSDWLRVQLDAHARPLKGGGALQIDGGYADVPLAQLVLENRINGLRPNAT